MTMLAARMHGVNDVRLERIEIPILTDNEILLKVQSVGICGTDLRMIKNGFPGICSEAPRILGHEISGIIEKVGSQVRHYKEGMRVAVAPNIGCGTCDSCVRSDYHLCQAYSALGVQMDGGFAEYVRIPETAVRFGNIAELPDHVTFEQAAVIEPLSCVYNGVQLSPIQLGDDVLIIGAGSIGMMYAMLAKKSGAARVMIANRTPERLMLCSKLDASFITLEADGLVHSVMELTGGRGVDVCVTANPSPEAQQIAVEAAAMHGRINFFGGLPKNGLLPSINTNAIHYKQLQVTGSTKANNYHFRKMLQFIASGIVDVNKLISRKFYIGSFQDALEYSLSSKGVKTIVYFDS